MSTTVSDISGDSARPSVIAHRRRGLRPAPRRARALRRPDAPGRGAGLLADLVDRLGAPRRTTGDQPTPVVESWSPDHSVLAAQPNGFITRRPGGGPHDAPPGGRPVAGHPPPSLPGVDRRGGRPLDGSGAVPRGRLRPRRAGVGSARRPRDGQELAAHVPPPRRRRASWPTTSWSSTAPPRSPDPAAWTCVGAPPSGSTAGTYLGVVGTRERWRVTLPPVPSHLPFGGWVQLDWTDELDVGRPDAASQAPRTADELRPDRPRGPDPGPARPAGLPDGPSGTPAHAGTGPTRRSTACSRRSPHCRPPDPTTDVRRRRRPELRRDDRMAVVVQPRRLQQRGRHQMRAVGGPVPPQRVGVDQGPVHALARPLPGERAGRLGPQRVGEPGLGPALDQLGRQQVAEHLAHQLGAVTQPAESSGRPERVEHPSARRTGAPRRRRGTSPSTAKLSTHSRKYRPGQIHSPELRLPAERDGPFAWHRRPGSAGRTPSSVSHVTSASSVAARRRCTAARTGCGDTARPTTSRSRQLGQVPGGQDPLGPGRVQAVARARHRRIR